MKTVLRVQHIVLLGRDLCYCERPRTIDGCSCWWLSGLQKRGKGSWVNGLRANTQLVEGEERHIHHPVCHLLNLPHWQQWTRFARQHHHHKTLTRSGFMVHLSALKLPLTVSPRHLKVCLNTTTVLGIDGCRLLLIWFYPWEIRKENVQWWQPSQPQIFLQGVVGSSCDGSSYFGSILFVVTIWHQERTSRPKYGRVFVGGSYS